MGYPKYIVSTAQDSIVPIETFTADNWWQTKSASRKWIPAIVQVMEKARLGFGRKDAISVGTICRNDSNVSKKGSHKKEQTIKGPTSGKVMNVFFSCSETNLSLASLLSVSGVSKNTRILDVVASFKVISISKWSFVMAVILQSLIFLLVAASAKSHMVDLQLVFIYRVMLSVLRDDIFCGFFLHSGCCCCFTRTTSSLLTVKLIPYNI